MLKTVGFFLFVLLAESVSAGHWADANGQCLDVNGQATACKWGQMYWGTGQAYTAPTAAPQMSVEVDATDIAASLTNLTNPGDDGWSAITQFIINCDGQDVIVAVEKVASGDAILSDLDADTNYTCSVVAVNDLGQSDAGKITFTTDPAGGLPIWLLYQATQT